MNNSREKLIALLCTCFLVIHISAQQKDFYFKHAPKNKQFPFYSEYVEDALHISWKKPKGFIDLRSSEVWSPTEKNESSFSAVTLQSKNGDCLILYPMVELVTPMPWRPSSLKYGELEFVKKQVWMDMDDALRAYTEIANVETKENSGDFTILTGDAVPMNADTVFVLKRTLQTPYKSKYVYYTGIYAYKRGRTPMIFRCLFTEKGKKNENRYLSKFYKTIYYQGDAWNIDKEKFNAH